MEIQKELNHEIVKNILKQGKRIDGRQKYEYRPVEIERDCIPNAEGSAICRMGKTQVLAAIKVDLATPFPDRPDEGVFSTGAEFTPIGAPHFEPGPPRVEAIELARVVDRGIRSSEMIDLKALALEGQEKVKALYLDLWILDYDGNLFDAATLASVAALQNTRMPKVEDGKIIRGEYDGTLDARTTVTSCTFAKLDQSFLLDPNFAEETGADGLLTVAVTPEHMCAGQKSGKAGFTQKDILELVDITFDKSKELRAILGQ